MKTKLTEKLFVYILLASLLVFFIILLALSQGYYGGGDNLTHYKFSRYSYLYPEFLIYHWGKPIFTLLTFPFAQFGFAGVQVFNIIAGLVSAYLCYLTAKELKYPNSPMAIIILCFTPVYTIIMMSGMTEILFGLFCILSVYLILKEKYILSSIIISFSFLVRTEGIYIIPVIGLVLLLRKKIRAIPFLLTGFIVYSIIGYFYYRDIFWLINEMPYRGATDVYGTGSVFHYIRTSNVYLGNLIRFMLCIGSIVLLVQLIRRFKDSLDEVLLIALPFGIYFLAHTLMWWSGIGNSDGNQRYMAAIVPFISLICLKGLNTIINNRLVLDIPGIKTFLITAFTIILIIIPFDIYSIPVKLKGPQKVIKECSDWLESTGYIKRKFYYYDPDFIYFLDFNPYDEKVSRPFVYSTEKPRYNIEPGSIVIWDAHYSPNNDLPLNKLMDSQDFKLIKVFMPDENFKVFGRDYMLCVFERVKNKTLDNYTIMKLSLDKEYAGYYPLAYSGFDKNFNHKDSLFVTSDAAYSGINSCKVDTTKHFFLSHSFVVSEISRMNNRIVFVSCKIFTNTNINPSILLIKSVEHENIPYKYSATRLDNDIIKPGKWYTIKSKILLPELKSDDDLLKVYFWNRDRNIFYVDDFYIGIKMKTAR